MKVKIPKVSRTPAGSLSPRKIARKFRSGYINLRKKESEKKGQPEIYAGMIPRLAQTIEIDISRQLKEGGFAGGQQAAGPVIEIKYRGVDIPTGITSIKGASAFSMPDEREDLRSVDIKTPLIPANPKKGDAVMAYAHIFWDKKSSSLVYSVIEPELTQKDRETIDRMKRELEERLDVNFGKIGEVKAKELLREEIGKIMSSLPDVDHTRAQILEYYIERDIIGLGVIESLMQDHEIEDVSCDGERIPIFVYHRNPKLGSMKTNIWFDAKEDLETFVLRLAQRCGKSISIAEPLLDASLPDGSRIQATLGTDIARRGSNFTIRKFTYYPLTPTHMIKYGTLDSTQLAYLWLAIEHGKSMLISGGTATGKTSLLNSLSLFIKPNAKILSIEDTPELRLPHTHWVPEVARSPLSVKGKTGEVTLFDLLKSSLRQRPDYLIVGEVRGKEAFVLFQQIATGHPSLATIHAATLPQLIDRLITPPISLPPSLIENIDIIVFLQRVKVNNRYERRSSEILEVIGVQNDRPMTVKVFEWNPSKDVFVSKEKSKILEDIARVSGVTEESIQVEMLRRKSIIDWMRDHQIFDYNYVSQIISGYYTNPERILALIEESG